MSKNNVRGIFLLDRRMGYTRACPEGAPRVNQMSTKPRKFLIFSLLLMKHRYFLQLPTGKKKKTALSIGPDNAFLKSELLTYFASDKISLSRVMQGGTNSSSIRIDGLWQTAENRVPPQSQKEILNIRELDTTIYWLKLSNLS